MSTANKPKQRKSFTDKERQRLRLYHKSYPTLTPHQLALWFEKEFGRRVSNSSVYDILSAKYAYLDTTEATDAVRKKKGPQCPELEEELYRWWQEVQPRDVNGKELRMKASDIWHTLLSCHGDKVPSFSDGWLSNWRARYGLTQFTRATDVKQSGLNKERTENIQSVASDLKIIRSPQLFDSTISNPPSPLTLPLEKWHHFAPMDFPDSVCQSICDPQFVWALPSTTHFCAPLNPPNQNKADLEVCEPPVKRMLPEGGHKVNGLELTSSHQSSTASPRVCAAHLGIYNPIDLSDKAMWNGIRRLFLMCNDQIGRDLTTTSTVVLNVLEPFLSSLDFKSQECSEIIHWRQRKAKKAIGLLYAAEEFRLQQAEDGLQHIFYEDWFLDFIEIRVLQSASPDPTAPDEAPSSRYSSSDDAIFKQHSNLRSKASFFSPITRNGTVDIWTRTYTNGNTANDEYAVEQFHATTVITPPTGIHSVPQIIIQLATRTTKSTSTISMPVISFRPIIPESSAIFNIAEYGTSSDLQMMLSRQGNSLYDCDPAGRSLINYALDGRNASTLKYLLTKVKDIDVYEPDSTGLPSSLVGMLVGFDRENCHYERDRRWTCLKLMLDAGADPSLNYYPTFESSTFELELHYGTVNTLKSLLDLGHPCVHANAAFASTFNYELEQTPLLSVAEHFHLLLDQSLDMSEKVFLLLRRGADIAARDRDGNTCLHLVLMLDADMEKEKFRAYQEDEFKDILMCMVTAGVDLSACDIYGKTISQTAVEYGHEGLWKEVIAECGYDPDEVFSLETEFRRKKLQKHPGMAVFSAMAPDARSTKLSFEEYGRQRKSLDCVQKAYSRKEVDFWAVRKEHDDFWETYIETSDSEDYERCSVGDEECNGDGATAASSELLHNGVHWLSAFSGTTHCDAFCRVWNTTPIC